MGSHETQSLCGQPLSSNTDLCVHLAISVMVELASFLVDYTQGLKETEAPSITPWLLASAKAEGDYYLKRKLEKSRFNTGNRGIQKFHFGHIQYELPETSKRKCQKGN